jgi:signal transduction histidine kinase/ligand-binding sensor domain-containing protein
VPLTPQYLILLLFVCLAACANVQAGPASGRPQNVAWAWAPNPLISVWGRENGLPQSAVSSVLHSSSGYLWVGTYNGLVRFDGENFQSFDKSHWPELKSGRVTALFEDSRGKLWVGDEMGGLSIVSEEGMTFRALPRNWSARSITAIRESIDGGIWLLLSNGELVRQRDGKSWRFQAEDVSTPDVPRMTTDFSGRVWVLGGDQRLQYLEGEQLQPWVPPANEKISSITFVGRAREGGVWIVSKGHTRRLKDGAWVEDRGVQPMGGGFISAFFETAGGTLSFGVMRSGLVFVSPKGESRTISVADGLSNEWVTDIAEDREGNLWVATVGGLNHLRIVRAEMVGSWDGAAVLGLDIDDQGALWAGTEGGGLHRLDKGVFTKFSEGSGLTKPYVWAVQTEPSGTVWAGTWGQGLFKGRDGQFAIAPGWDPSALTVTAILRAGDGTLWVGSNRGLACLREGKWTWWHETEGRALINVRCLAEDGRGGLWFGTSGSGLGFLKEGKISLYGQAQGLPSDDVWSLLPSDGGLWIGTSGLGLVRMQGERFYTFRANAGFPSQTICGLVKSDDGRIWISSYGGVVSFPEQNLLHAVRSGEDIAGGIYVDKTDGLASLECAGGMQRSLLLDFSGALWVPTAKGLARVETAVRERLTAPRAVIRQVLLDDQATVLDLGKPLHVPPGFHRVEISFAALRFASPQRVEFRYRLLGLGEEWISAERKVQFNYLPPGSYELQVQARDKSGPWDGDIARVDIVVAPYFWQRTSLRVVFACLLIFSTAWVARVSAHRREKLKLAQLEREHAVERERTRIAQDLHDDLGASLTQLNLLTQSSNNSPEANTGNFADIRKVTVEITRAMDEVVWAASPRHDTLESLVGYLARFTQEMANASGLRCRLKLPLDVPAMALTAEFRHNLFLATKETLNNAVRHARAKEILLHLECDLKGRRLRLTIRDDGTGFDVTSHRQGQVKQASDAHGNGLPGLERRLNILQGEFRIVSEAGVGTTVEFDVPLPSN